MSGPVLVFSRLRRERVPGTRKLVDLFARMSDKNRERLLDCAEMFVKAARVGGREGNLAKPVVTLGSEGDSA